MCINTSQSQLTVKFPPSVGNQKEKFTFDASTLLWRNPFCRLPWPGLASLWTLKDGLRIEGWHVQFCLMKFALQFANNCGRTINLDKVLCLLCLRRVGSVCGLRYEALFLSTSAYFMLNSRKHKTKTVRLGIYMFMFVQNVSTHMDIYIGSPRCRYSFCPEHIFNFA